MNNVNYQNIKNGESFPNNAVMGDVFIYTIDNFVYFFNGEVWERFYGHLFAEVDIDNIIKPIYEHDNLTKDILNIIDESIKELNQC